MLNDPAHVEADFDYSIWLGDSSPASPANNLQAALDLAGRGFNVFPVRDWGGDALWSNIAELREAGFALHWLQRKKKTPVGSDGYGADWSNLPVASLADLRATHKPGYNLGVRLGKWSALTTGGYLLVIDMDIRLPDLADEAWEALREILPVDPDSLPMVRSGSGGESVHLYFVTDKPFDGKKLVVSEGKHRRWDNRLKKEVWSHDWEIDLFGTDRQVAMPPSVHPDSGLPYIWEREFDFFELALGDGPVIDSDDIEAMGAAESGKYLLEDVELPTFKPGQLQRVLDDIPLARIDDRDDWIRIGQALHLQFGGSEEGFRLWMEVSSRGSKFLVGSSERAELRRYRGFGRNRKRPITLLSIAKWANEARLNASLDDADEFDDLEPLQPEDVDDFEALLDGGTTPSVAEPKANDFPDDFDKNCPPAGEKNDNVPGWVARLNERHSVAHVEGKTVVLTKKPNGSVAYGSVADLHHFYENVRRETKAGSEAITRAWMREKGRASYRNGIGFWPAGGPKGAFNHWRGFSVIPDAGQSCALFLQHVRDVICCGDDIAYQWLICWFAHMIQRPGEKPGTAVVLKGRKGSGKDTVGDYVGGLFPHHHTKIGNAEHLYGRFNAHQERTLLLHVEEGFWAGDKKAEGSLKHVITSEQVQIEPKGINAFQVASVLRVFISSNEDWIVPASFDERRFFVMNVGAKRGPDYYTALRVEMESGGRAGLLHHLQTLDLTGYDVRNPPVTAGLVDQKLASLRNVEAWWFEQLQRASLPHNSLDDDDWATAPQSIGRDALRSSYVDWMARRRYDGPVANQVHFGRRIREMVPALQDTRPWAGGDRVRRYLIPNLMDCRRGFSDYLGGPVTWDDG